MTVSQHQSLEKKYNPAYIVPCLESTVSLPKSYPKPTLQAPYTSLRWAFDQFEAAKRGPESPL